MKQLKFLVILMLVTLVGKAQAPSNYTNINGRYRWIAGMFDSTFHIPKGTTPSLRTGGSTNAGALFYRTSDSTVRYWTGTQWLTLSDTTRFVPYVGAIKDVDLNSWSLNAKSLHVKGTAGNGHLGLRFQSATPNMSANETGLYSNANGDLGVKIDNAYTSIFKTHLNSADRTYTFQNKSYTVADSADVEGKIGGTLISGYLTKATGTKTIDTSQIYQNGQNVGIGTLTPDGRIAIVDTGGFALKINYNSASTDANSNAAIYAENNGLSSYVTIFNEKTTNNTGGQYPLLVESSLSSGTAQSGMATGIHFGVPDDAGNRKVTQLALRTTDPAAATYTNRAELRLWNAGTLSTPYYLLGNGNMGLGTSTPDSNLTVTNGTWLKRGVRMSALPTGVGTKALRIDATGNVSVADTLTNGISGSLTTNFIPKATGTSTIGNSNFQTDANGNLGIGTSLSNWNNGYRAIQSNTTLIISSPIGSNIGNNFYIDNTGNAYYLQNGGATMYQTYESNHRWVTAPSGTTGGVTTFTERMLLNPTGLGIGTSPDSLLTVNLGSHLKRGVRMSGLPTGVGTKALRIDANGNVSATDTTATTGFVPYTGATTSLDMGLFNIYGQNIISTNYATGAAMSSISRSDVTSNAYGTLLLKRGVWGTLQPNPLTTFDKNWYLPDTSGTLALASQLSGYVPTTRTITINGTSQDLSANRTYNVGTVTSVATSTGTGITGGTITSTGTIAADTLLLSTRAWRQKGIDSVAALISSNISGTTNYIPKFTSSSAIGNSVIYESGGNIGLNTTTPQTDAGYGNLTLNGTTGGQLGFQTNGSTKGSIYHDGTNYSYVNSQNGYQRWYNNNLERMRLDASGNLGLGVTPSAWSSTYKTLQINDASFSAFTSGYTWVGNNWFVNAGNKYIANGFSTLYEQNSGKHIWYTAPNNTSGAGAALTFTQAMTLDASGRLGIGTSSPTDKLVVEGGRTTLTASSEVYQLKLSYNSGTNGFWLGSPSADALAFYNNAGTERLRINSSGELLINTTTDVGDYKLQVSGNVYASGSVDIGTTGGTRKLTVYSTNDGNYAQYISQQATTNNSYGLLIDAGTSSVDAALRVRSKTGTDYFYVRGDGNVGIGTTSPTDLLSLSGGQNGLSINSQTTGDSYIRFRKDGTVSTDMYVDRATENFFIGPSVSSALILKTNAAERMRITSGGELLINTTTDAGDYKLQVNGNGRFVGDIRATVDLYLSRTGTSPAIVLEQSQVRLVDQSTGNGSSIDVISGGLQFGGSIKTAAPSGGTAAAWKLGSRVASAGVTFNDQQYIQLDIGGTLYYLATVDLPMPEAYPQATSGPSNNYKITPVQVKTTKDVEIEKLRKELDELKQMIKNLNK
jgi:hypothetical protein